MQHIQHADRDIRYIYKFRNPPPGPFGFPVKTNDKTAENRQSVFADVIQGFDNVDPKYESYWLMLCRKPVSCTAYSLN